MAQLCSIAKLQHDSKQPHVVKVIIIYIQFAVIAICMYDRVHTVFCLGNIEWWLTSLGSRSKRKTRNYTSLYNAQYACAHARARLELSPPTNLIVLYSAHSDSI